MNSIFSRLAIGTANWAKPYNGAKVSEDDQKRILDYCQCSGIDMIDTATAYEWDGWRESSTFFGITLKARLKDLPIYSEAGFGTRVNLLAHDISEYEAMCEKQRCSGYSIYEVDELSYRPQIIQLPYSIYDRRFESYFANLQRHLPRPEIHVRSIFLRGKLLKKFTPWECIAFCLMNPNIDRVIIGVDSFEQLKDNLRIFHRMAAAEISDLDIIDPRRWAE